MNMSTQNLRILSVSTSDSKGGASIAAFRLHNSINKHCKEIESNLLVARKYRNHKNIIPYYYKYKKLIYFSKLYFSRRIQSLQRTTNSIAHSGNYFPSFIHKYINKYPTDIIHLHWVQDEFLPVNSISKIKKPLLWTLHDSWPFCGSEHHPKINDNRYVEGYNISNREKIYLKSFRNLLFNPDLDCFNWKMKKKLSHKNITFVAPSKWMRECISKSYLFKNKDCEIIPNPVPETFYSAFNKTRIFARKYSNLPLKKPIFIFVANRADLDVNKGWYFLKNILKELSRVLDFHLLTIGGQCKIELFGKSTHEIKKRVDSITDLSLLYRSADLLLLPSLIETLPQVATECITTGTPVIAFKGSGTEDVVINGITGLLVNRFDEKHFYESILEIISMDRKKFGNSCFSYSSSNWKEEIIVNKFRSLYYKILKKNY